MKYLLIILLSVLFVDSYGQVLTHDAQMNWTTTTKWLQDKEAQLKARMQNYELIKKTAETLKNARETKERIQEMWDLQEQIRNELKICADGIKGLNFNSLAYLGAELTGESFNPADYIVETDFTGSLKKSLDYKYSDEVSKQTQHVFREWFTSNPDNPSDLLAYTTELGNLITNNNEYRTKNAIARALEDLDFTTNFNVVIDSIFNVVNSDNTIELTDADRLNFNIRLAELKTQNRIQANTARLELVNINQRINKIRLKEYQIKLNLDVMESLMDSTLKFRANPTAIPRLSKFDKTLN